MTHDNYIEIRASSYFDLGLQEGTLFKTPLVEKIKRKKSQESWNRTVHQSKTSLSQTKEAFPHLIEELHGYAQGAGVLFDDLWTASLEEQTPNIDRCTTVVTNNGNLIAHNEDWEAKAKDKIFILKKTIKDVTIFEFFYVNTLGGNALSINSNGYIQAINTLTHSDNQSGIPRNIIARWMSETENIEQDFSRFSSLKRAHGYSHVLVDTTGKIWNIESTACEQILSTPSVPFIHTNHYLSGLRRLEHNDNATGTYERHDSAKETVRDTMSIDDMKTCMSDVSKGSKKSILNERTIGRIVVDLSALCAHVWMLRESSKGWVEYDLKEFVR